MLVFSCIRILPTHGIKGMIKQKLLLKSLALSLALIFCGVEVNQTFNLKIHKTQNLGSYTKTQAKDLLELYNEIAAPKDKVKMIESLKIKKGSKIIEIGSRGLWVLGLLSMIHGGDFLGIEINQDDTGIAEKVTEILKTYLNLKRFGGNANHIQDDFIDHSKNIPDNQIDVFILSSVLSSQAIEFSKKVEILTQVFMKAKNMSKLLLERMSGKREFKREQEVIQETLKVFDGKIELVRIIKGKLGYPSLTLYQVFTILKSEDLIKGNPKSFLKSA